MTDDPPPIPGVRRARSAQVGKDDVASDVLALLDALGLDRVLLVAHDWGAAVGYLMILRAPERFDGYLVMNMAHPWVSTRTVLPHLWRFWYQLPLATFGVPVQQRTGFVERVFERGSAVDSESGRVFAERFRDPVCARAGRDTYHAHFYYARCRSVQGITTTRWKPLTPLISSSTSGRI